MEHFSSPEKPLSLVTGAAGFIGCRLADRLVHEGHYVIGLDNFVRGKRENLARMIGRSDFTLLDVDCSDVDSMAKAVCPIVLGKRVDVVWHLAANSDIAAGVADSRIDLRDTLMTTFATLEVMRQLDAKRIVFSSSSAVYGVHDQPIRENDGPLLPTSNYGAMKLASEALISAAMESFLERAWICRFPNVVGSPATHGVIFDLLGKLRKNPNALEVLGDGNQCKPYLHVAELIDAMLFIWRFADLPLSIYNIGPDDRGATVRFIAEEIIRIAAPQTPISFSGGERGWVGDVPRFSYNTEKLRQLGWSTVRTSEEAIRTAIKDQYEKPDWP